MTLLSTSVLPEEFDGGLAEKGEGKVNGTWRATPLVRAVPPLPGDCPPTDGRNRRGISSFLRRASESFTDTAPGCSSPCAGGTVA